MGGTQSQVPGVRMWTSLQGSIILPTTPIFLGCKFCFHLVQVRIRFKSFSLEQGLGSSSLPGCGCQKNQVFGLCEFLITFSGYSTPGKHRVSPHVHTHMNTCTHTHTHTHTHSWTLIFSYHSIFFNLKNALTENMVTSDCISFNWFFTLSHELLLLMYVSDHVPPPPSSFLIKNFPSLPTVSRSHTLYYGNWNSY